MSGIILLCGSCNSPKNGDKPPIAPKKPKEIKIHGDSRIDNYYWLNEKKNPEVIEYLEAENAYTKKKMKHTEALQEKIFEEMKSRIKKDDNSVPYRKNGYFYYQRYEKDKEYPVYCRKKDEQGAKEEIMLEINEMAKGFAYYQVKGLNVSPDNNLLAFGVDTLSRRKYTLYVKNLNTGELLDFEVKNTDGDIVWANDSKTLFFTKKDEQTLRENKVFSRNIESKEDILIFEEKDETFYVDISKSKSEKYLFICSGSTLTTEYRLLDANEPTGNLKVFQHRERDLQYYVEHNNNEFVIRTNFKAKNFRLMSCAENNTEKENWKELIAHQDNVLIEDFELFDNFTVVEERKNGFNQLRIINNETKEGYFIDFEEEAHYSWISVNEESDTEKLRFGYTSLTTPTSIFDYDMRNKKSELLKQFEVKGDFKVENYETKLIYAKAKDGVKIPISIVYRKGTKLDGSAPLLQYGYGSYGASMDPYFSSSRLSLLDRGFIYAIAHIRGGEEMGYGWYEDGKLLKKKNTFTDFIACSEHLIKNNYTKADNLFAMGGSAGGLLIGAVINMRPDLYKGVIAAVPFVDVVTTMLDESIPLTTGEFDEWGNPKEKKYYDYMLSYSPYDNVKAQDYPAMLVTTGLHDSQVQYFEPAKWVAKLRDLKTDDNLLLLDIDMTTGHGGASGRFKRLKNTALEYAFFLDLAGVKLP